MMESKDILQRVYQGAGVHKNLLTEIWKCNCINYQEGYFSPKRIFSYNNNDLFASFRSIDFFESKENSFTRRAKPTLVHM